MYSHLFGKFTIILTTVNVELLKSQCYVEAYLVLPFGSWVAVIFSRDQSPTSFLSCGVCVPNNNVRQSRVNGFECDRHSKGAVSSVTTFSDTHHASRMFNTPVVLWFKLTFQM